MERRPLIGVAVIIVKERKVLLGKRKNSHGENSWGFPGGHLEWQESIEDAAKRETLEETGLIVENISYGPFVNTIFKSEDKHYVTLYVLATCKEGEAKSMEPHKCEKWEWFSWDQLPQPLFLPIQNLLKQGFNPFKN